MKQQKEFTFRYVTNIDLEDVGLDPSGEYPIPQKGDIISRRETEWKVIHVVTTDSPDGRTVFVRVLLTDKFDLP